MHGQLRSKHQVQNSLLQDAHGRPDGGPLLSGQLGRSEQLLQQGTAAGVLAEHLGTAFDTRTGRT